MKKLRNLMLSSFLLSCIAPGHGMEDPSGDPAENQTVKLSYTRMFKDQKGAVYHMEKTYEVPKGERSISRPDGVELSPEEANIVLFAVAAYENDSWQLVPSLFGNTTHLEDNLDLRGKSKKQEWQAVLKPYLTLKINPDTGKFDDALEYAALQSIILHNTSPQRSGMICLTPSLFSCSPQLTTLGLSGNQLFDHDLNWLFNFSLNKTHSKSLRILDLSDNQLQAVTLGGKLQPWVAALMDTEQFPALHCVCVQANLMLPTAQDKVRAELPEGRKELFDFNPQHRFLVSPTGVDAQYRASYQLVKSEDGQVVIQEFKGPVGLAFTREEVIRFFVQNPQFQAYAEQDWINKFPMSKVKLQSPGLNLKGFCFTDWTSRLKEFLQWEKPWFGRHSAIPTLLYANLRHLTLEKVGFIKTPEGVAMIQGVLDGAPKLALLDLSGNGLDTPWIQEAFAPGSPTVTKVLLHRNKFENTENSLSALAATLSKFPKLKQLGLEENTPAFSLEQLTAMPAKIKSARQTGDSQ